MFFYLSKILQYFYSPLLWIVLILILSFCLRKDKIKRILRIISLVMILFFTNPFIVNMFVGIWEIERTPDENLKPKYTYGIVLTGMISYDRESKKINFGKSADRIFEAVRLYYSGKIEKIYISGGSGFVTDQEHKESQLLKDYLVGMNVPGDDIIIETESKNTHENAVEAAKMLQPNQNRDTYLLITSSSHIRRSAKCFAHEGFTFDLYPVDNNYKEMSFLPESWLIPSPEAFSIWNLLIHEMVGYVMYDIMGYF